MADLSATTKIETFMITVCWTEFHIKITIKSEKMAKRLLRKVTGIYANSFIKIHHKFG